MAKRERLGPDQIQAFIDGHPGWALADGALAKTFAFPSYAPGVAFVVEVAFAAEKRDHHPDLHVGWGKVKVGWSTHDAGGITALDCEMAEATDRLHRG